MKKITFTLKVSTEEPRKEWIYIPGDTQPWLDVGPSSLLEAGLHEFHRSLLMYVVLLCFTNLWASSLSKYGES